MSNHGYISIHILYKLLTYGSTSKYQKYNFLERLILLALE